MLTKNITTSNELLLTASFSAFTMSSNNNASSPNFWGALTAVVGTWNNYLQQEHGRSLISYANTQQASILGDLFTDNNASSAMATPSPPRGSPTNSSRFKSTGLDGSSRGSDTEDDADVATMDIDASEENPTETTNFSNDARPTNVSVPRLTLTPARNDTTDINATNTNTVAVDPPPAVVAATSPTATGTNIAIPALQPTVPAVNPTALTASVSQRPTAMIAAGNPSPQIGINLAAALPSTNQRKKGTFARNYRRKPKSKCWTHKKSHGNKYTKKSGSRSKRNHGPPRVFDKTIRGNLQAATNASEGLIPINGIYYRTNNYRSTRALRQSYPDGLLKTAEYIQQIKVGTKAYYNINYEMGCPSFK